ncbi:hypothetical protein ACF1FX_32375 [Streptomyces sp. NPDC014646]|uniref:hypothetical protein n=1 Tax=Streptomyces sp. NPDC014646 TaxID=3364877 RepID=UPI003702EF7C
MDKARLYQHGTVGETVFAHEIDNEPWWRREKVPLVCQFCLTSVVSQRTSIGRSPRAALFRLAADQQHKDVCPLNPVEVLQKIAHGSQGVAVIEGDELHLVLPDDVGQIGDAAPVVGAGPAAPGDPFGVNINTVRPLLPPLINSAVVIVRFLQKHGFDTDVVGQFKVRRPGETKAVGWGEFCHGPAPGDQARLYARMTSGPKPGHPVAVYGPVTAVERDSRHRPVLRLADGDGFTVRVRSDHPSLLDLLAPGIFVLAVGAWQVWKPLNGKPELQMFAEEHWQLAHWTHDSATGRSGPPTCPPPLSLAQRTLRQARAAAAARKPASGRAVGPLPQPRTTAPPPPPPVPSTPPVPPTTAELPSAAAAEPPTPTPSAPGKPADVPVAPARPAHPPLPPRPSTPPRPAAPRRRRARRGWWLFGRRR